MCCCCCCCCCTLQVGGVFFMLGGQETFMKLYNLISNCTRLKVLEAKTEEMVRDCLEFVEVVLS